MELSSLVVGTYTQDEFCTTGKKEIAQAQESYPHLKYVLLKENRRKKMVTVTIVDIHTYKNCDDI